MCSWNCVELIICRVRHLLGRVHPFVSDSVVFYLYTFMLPYKLERLWSEHIRITIFVS